MFAFALWDRERRELLLARDRVGIKPLYYAVAGGELVFGSEMKALLQHPAVQRRINPLSVSKYLTFSYIPAPHTIFQDVQKLEPGHWLRFSERGLEKGCYWDIPLEDNPISEGTVDERADELLAILRDSVTKQLRSDVPVGVFLSGGIDSSTVTALAAQAVPGRLHTFSVGFEESSYDESPFARQVAERYGTEHHHEVLSLQRAVDLLPTVMNTLDEPFGDASILPTYLLSQFTARHVKVVLGGDGGDELFAGLSVLPGARDDGEAVGAAHHVARCPDPAGPPHPGVAPLRQRRFPDPAVLQGRRHLARRSASSCGWARSATTRNAPCSRPPCRPTCCARIRSRTC
jgi:asparagine synthase (glutamine-hydrolysing)